MARHGLLALAAMLLAASAAAGAPEDVNVDYEDALQPREGSAALLASALEHAAQKARLPVADMALQWADFKVAHRKSYKSLDEEAGRILVFADNLQYINEHNARYDNGQTTYYMGVNHLADLTSGEIAAFYLGSLPQALRNTPKMDESELANLTAPRSVDWRTRGVVTPVKNQAQCGSCWAFAATGALEGANARKTRRLRSFSEQQLVDCARGSQYRNQGCNGGWPQKAIEYVRDHGIATEQAYPYTHRDGQCHYSPSMRAGSATGFVHAPRNGLDRAVARYGPLAVALDASQRSFGFYRGGVYYDPQCKTNHHNHAVTLVGYTRDYWLLKNSWSAGWGDRGYMKMNRRRGNDCGVTVWAFAATV